MINIAEIIGWKFNHQPGMRCKTNQVTGELEIVEFPRGIPTQEQREQWKVEYTKVKLAEIIRAEGLKRVSEFMEGADFDVAAGLYLSLKRGKGQTWTAGESVMADDLFVKFTYIRDLYVTAKQAIANIPNLTIEQKENFNAATDVAWPLPPA